MYTKTKKMINIKLLLIEYTIENTNGDNKKLEAIESIREIISQTDFTDEEIPMDDPERLNQLLASIKGEQLTEQELDIVYEITNN